MRCRWKCDPGDRERACGSFDLPVKKAARTHHFRVLREAGLIVQRDHGNGSAVSLARRDIDLHLPGLLALLCRELETGGRPGQGAEE